MKKYINILIVFIVTMTLSSCYVSSGNGRNRVLPPGHAKSEYGSKSAKKYAPGQKKKHKKQHDDRKREKKNRKHK